MAEDGSTAAGDSAAAVLSVPHDDHSPVFTCVVGHAALRGCGGLHVSMLCDALPDPQRVVVAPPHQLRPQRSRAIRHRIFFATGRVGEPTKPGGAVRGRHASSCCCWAAACSGCLRYAEHVCPALADMTCDAGCWAWSAVPGRVFSWGCGSDHQLGTYTCRSDDVPDAPQPNSLQAAPNIRPRQH